MTAQKHTLGLDRQWHDCPNCKYDGGWHVFFSKAADRNQLAMQLQCPGCKERFDLGLTVNVN